MLVSSTLKWQIKTDAMLHNLLEIQLSFKAFLKKVLGHWKIEIVAFATTLEWLIASQFIPFTTPSLKTDIPWYLKYTEHF